VTDTLTYYNTATITTAKSFILHAPEVVIIKFLMIILPTYIRQWRKWLEVVNALAYYDTTTIMAVKSLIVQAPEVLIKFFYSYLAHKY